MRFLRFLMVALLCVLGSVIIAWTVGALYFDLPAPPMLRMAAAIVWALGAAVLGIFGGWRGRIAVLLGVVVIAAWWSTLCPRNDRDWQPEIAVLGYATREDDQLTVHNIRNFEYRTATDFAPVYDTRTYDLGNLRALDLFVNYCTFALSGTVPLRPIARRAFALSGWRPSALPGTGACCSTAISQ
jgi:hypothetical protein